MRSILSAGSSFFDHVSRYQTAVRLAPPLKHDETKDPVRPGLAVILAVHDRLLRSSLALVHRGREPLRL
mgnify:CR=1 FL=1